MFRRRRGSSLSTVLIVSGLLLTVLFTMAEAVVFHLQFATSLESEHEARNLAESAVHEAMSELLQGQNYGKNGEPPLIVGDAGKHYGIVSFVSDGRVPRSLNHLESMDEVTGSTGRPVPANTVHLVGCGYAGRSQRTVEVLFYRPPFPKAISSSGPIVATNAHVTGLKAGEDYPPGSSAALAPGSLQSNSRASGSNPAIKLINCQVSGDVAAAGEIKVDALSQIDGEVRMKGDPQPIPKIDVEACIKDIQNVDGTEILSGTVAGRKVTWYCGCPSGDLTVQGDLELENGVLWTGGNLTVTGGVKGQGLILSGGNVTVQKGSQLNSENMVALAAKGDVSLEGLERSTYSFQGLVYTNGNFSAHQMTVLGSVITDSPDPNRGEMTLQDVDFAMQPDSLNLSRSIALTVEDIVNTNGKSASKENKSPPNVPVQKPSKILFQFSETPASLRDFPDSSTDGARKFDFTMINSGWTPPRITTWKNISSDQISEWTRPDEKNHGWHSPLTKTNWYLPMPSDGDQNDAYTQINNTFQRSRQQMEQNQWIQFPAINNLLPAAERSRVLLWVSY
ncbi:MAG: hypothetical protein KF760_18575 [Candidatus Eremiobacteraeota bacterium]|nr:hypothetical protein [Candidatus Eremiobacteraeota bacterium]